MGIKAIPAIDLIDNKVIRLFKGDYEQKTEYAHDPVEYAMQIAAAGLDRLHLVDLSGAEKGKPFHLEVLQQICTKTSLKVDFGGGVKTEEDVKAIFEAGADQVVIGSLCVKDPALVVSWIEKYNVGRFVLAVDTDGDFVRINGWKDSSGLTLEEVLKPFLSFTGITILTTDIRRDGTGKGTNVGLYDQLSAAYPDFQWIASGGVHTMEDLNALRPSGATGCVIGKALLEGTILLSDLKTFNELQHV